MSKAGKSDGAQGSPQSAIAEKVAFWEKKFQDEKSPQSAASSSPKQEQQSPQSAASPKKPTVIELPLVVSDHDIEKDRVRIERSASLPAPSIAPSIAFSSPLIPTHRRSASAAITKTAAPARKPSFYTPVLVNNTPSPSAASTPSPISAASAPSPQARALPQIAESKEEMEANHPHFSHHHHTQSDVTTKAEKSGVMSLAARFQQRINSETEAASPRRINPNSIRAEQLKEKFNQTAAASSVTSPKDISPKGIQEARNAGAGAGAKPPFRG